MKTRHFLVVFLVLSLLELSFSSLAEFSLNAETIDTRIPEISKDYFPSSTPSILVSSKSKAQPPLLHAYLYLQFLHLTHLPGTHFSLAEIVPSSAISEVALGTVMRN